MAQSDLVAPEASTRRRTRVIILAAAGALLLALTVVHAAPVRAIVLRRVASAVRTSYGIDLRAGSLAYNVLTLSAELRGVELASVEAPSEPFAAADVVGVTFGARILMGDVDLRRLSLAAPRLNIRRHEDGTDNLPPVRARAGGDGLVLPAIAVDDLEVSFQQPDLSVLISGASVRLTSAEPGKVAAAIDARRGVQMTAGGQTIDVGASTGVVDIDGQQVAIRDLTATRPGTVLRANGRIDLRGEASSVDLTVTGSSEIESWWAEFRDDAGPVGRVEGTARLTGPLSRPTIAFESTAPSLAWFGVSASAIRTSGNYAAGQLSLDTVTLNVAGGSVEGRGTIAVDDPRRSSRIDARWAGVDARRIPGASRFAGALSNNGSAVVEWRREAPSASRVFGISATTGLVASDRTTEIDVRGTGQAGRWQVEVSSRDSTALLVDGAADIRLDARQWNVSPIVGRVAIRTTDLPGVIRHSQTFGATTRIDPATAAGEIELDATLTGTLAAVQLTGRLTGRSVTLAGLPPSDLDASFGIDVARTTSAGTFRLLAPQLASSTLAAQSSMVLGGALTAAGTWSGPLSAPIVDASVTGRNLTVTRAGSVMVTATGGTLDATLKGPVDDPAGEGTLTIASVQIGGREAGDVVADLAMAADVVRVRARAPGLNAAVDASIGLATPNSVEGRGTVADYDIQALGELLGLTAADASALRGTISSSMSFNGDLQNPAAMAVELDVDPLDAGVFDVPIALARGLRLTLAGGRLEIEDRTMAIGGVDVRARGAFLTDGSEGTLVLDLDGEIGTLQPWLRRADPTSELSAAGRITGHLEAGRVGGEVGATGTLNGMLSTLSSRDKTLARDVGVVIEFTGQRAELRQIAGTVLDGRLEATGGAPLVWLNEWLPGSWQLEPPDVAAPATLEGKASFDVASLLDVFGRTPLEGLRGGIDLSASLTASRPDVMAVAGDVRLDRAEVTAREQAYVQSGVTRFRLSAGSLAVDTLDWRGPGSTVVGRGSVGLLTGIEHDLRLDVDTELGIIGTLVSGRATGRLAGSIELRGQSGASRLAADAALSNASWLIPNQRILFAGWSGQVRLTDDELSLANLGGTVNGGTVRIDGQLPLRAQGAGGGLTIAARDILLDVPRGLHSQLGADLVWQRTDAAAMLRGKVEVTANRYTEPVTRILELVNSLASETRSSGESTLPPWLAGTALEISIAVTDPIFIDNSVTAVELTPDLRLGGTIDSPALSGRIDVADDGRIQLGGRAYRLRDSLVRFAPVDGVVPTLDVVGDTRIGDYDVTIRIRGTPDRIETDFTSVPPLGERELQSLIVTGRTDNQLGQDNQSDNFAVAAATTDILGFAGKFVGLDTVRIGASDLDLVSKDVNTAQHLTVAKSLGSSFDLIFSDNLEDGSVTWVLVWKPTTVNEVRASSVEDGTRALEFRRSLVFGPGSPDGARGGSRPAQAQQPAAVVDAVQITGNPGFIESEVSDRLELSPGDRFDIRRWIEDRQRLEAFYLDRGYHRVRIASTRSEGSEGGQVSLAYDIDRGPRTVIESSGDPLPDDVLDAMYEAWRGLPIADVVRAEFERMAREGLARRGYYRPTLRLEFPTETPDLARVTMHVTRGPRTSRLNVAWVGTRDVSPAELDALLVPHRAESDVWLDWEAITFEVRRLYASRGHLQTRVTVGEATFLGADATLPIMIDEGVQSRLVDVRIEGVDPTRMAGAQETLGFSIGEALAAAAPVEAARRLKGFYAGLGYRNATVTHALTTGPDGATTITWVVDEGPRYRVKDVNVVGVETTNEGLVQNAITLEPGDVASQGAVDTTRRNLYDIGSFRRVDVTFGDAATLSPGTDELPLTLTIQTEEPQRFQLKYGIQFSFDRSATSTGSAVGGSVELRDRNFIGRAVQASIGAHWDPDLQTLAMLLSSPRLFGKRVRTNFYVRERHEQDLLNEQDLQDGSPLLGASLTDRRREATLEQRWRPATDLELVWGYNISSRRFLLVQDDQRFDAGGWLSGPVFSAILDRRDSPFDATRGWFHSSSFQFGVEPLGSEAGYLRYLLRQSYSQPLGKLTAAGSLRWGMIQGLSGEAPIGIVDLLFKAGGTNTVRGYSEESLSALNPAGFELGGTDLLILNGELRFPISRLFGGAAFVDAGNTFASTADIVLGRLAVGAGLGLRIRTPLAPLRLDVAYPFSSEFGQSGVRVHFSIGQMF